MDNESFTMLQESNVICQFLVLVQSCCHGFIIFSVIHVVLVVQCMCCINIDVIINQMHTDGGPFLLKRNFRDDIEILLAKQENKSMSLSFV